MFIILLFSLLPLLAGATDVWCAQCASAGLQDQWQLTGLSTYPSNLNFTDKCKSSVEEQSKASTDWPDLIMKTCTESCMEIYFPQEDGYQVLRGCQTSFLTEDVKNELTVKATDNCTYAYIDDLTYSYSNNNEQKTAKAVSLVNFCKPTAEDIACNSQWTDVKLMNSQSELTKTCTETKSLNCYECERVGDSGDCPNQPDTTSTGPVCIKLTGTLNGQEITKRSHALLPPFFGNVCLNVNSSMTLQTPLDQKIARSRVKRAIQVNMEVTECFCYGDKCNPASISQYGLVFLLLLTSAGASFF